MKFGQTHLRVIRRNLHHAVTLGEIIEEQLDAARDLVRVFVWVERARLEREILHHVIVFGQVV